MNDHTGREEVLDACVERLLDGDDWESELPAGHEREEVAGLMRVAELLMNMARGLPGPGARTRTRVWDQVRENGGSLRTALGQLFVVRALPVPV